MNDTPANATAPAAEKRKAVSKRLYLLADGTETDKIESATGARYMLLDPAGNHSFDQQFGDAGHFATMCAIFGFHTKVGNVVNTVLNDKDEPGSPSEAAAAASAWIEAASAAEPVWAERAAGGEARIDRDALAGAIAAVAAAAGHTPDLVRIRQRMEDEKGYVTKARKNPDIAKEYAARVGSTAKTVTVDDLL